MSTFFARFAGRACIVTGGASSADLVRPLYMEMPKD